MLAVPTKALRFNPDPELLVEIGVTVTGSQAADGEDTRTVWVRKGNEISPKTVTTGHTSGDKTGITCGLSDGEEVVTGLSAEAPRKEEATERSPFAPGPRGDKKK